QAAPAQAGWRENLDAAVETTRAWVTELAIGAETAVVAGGVVLHRYRHTVAGGMIGCVAGAAAGTTVSAGAGLATGGAAFAAASGQLAEPRSATRSTRGTTGPDAFRVDPASIVPACRAPAGRKIAHRPGPGRGRGP